MKTSYASFILGVGLTLMLAACSIALAKTSVISSWHISPLILGIVLKHSCGKCAAWLGG